MILLTVNSGSSSVRLAALESSGTQLHGIAARHLDRLDDRHEQVLGQFVQSLGQALPEAVVHRFVHGGADLVEPCVITPQVQQRILDLAPLAPLHNPAAVAWLQACRTVLGPRIPHIAVFDTAFYAAMPQVARQYALPRRLTETLGLRRYGFHGLAHEGMLRRWRALEPAAAPDARVISLQLGAGCSITATRGGTPVDTSMGFSPLEGLVMATRCGDIDAGLLLHLQRTQGLSPADLERLLNAESGLLGVSGISADMRDLLASGDAAARLAVDLFCYRARKYVGAYMAALGGVDAVLFGGGIGENSAEVRERVLGGFGWAGLELDAEANRRAIGIEARISPAGAAAGLPAVWSMTVDEARVLAEQGLRVLGYGGHGGPAS
jgi:acetate kinase